MTKTSTHVCVAFLSIVLASSASAQNAIGNTPLPPSIYGSTQRLLEDLERPKSTDLNMASWSRGLGYLMAILDEARYATANSIEAFKSDPNMRESLRNSATRDSLAAAYTCVGSAVTAEQTEAVVVKFIKDNPARWNQRALFVVKDALRQAFPCKPEIFLP